jgi:hypothetical protein
MFEKRKGFGWRLKMPRPTFFRWMRKRPTAVYEFRYERADGMHRTITCPVGWGRFKRGKEDDAFELAERRLGEQFGQESINYAHSINNVAQVEERPDLHQDNYELKQVTKL